MSIIYQRESRHLYSDKQHYSLEEKYVSLIALLVFYYLFLESSTFPQKGSLLGHAAFSICPVEELQKKSEKQKQLKNQNRQSSKIKSPTVVFYLSINLFDERFHKQSWQKRFIIKCPQDGFVQIQGFSPSRSQGGLNNHRKLSATPRQSYLDLVPEETGTEAWKQVLFYAVLIHFLKIR